MSKAPLLISKRFLPLFLTQFGVAFNDNMFRYVLVTLVTFKLTVSELPLDPKIIASIAGALLVAPYILFSSIAGELADKYERSRLMRITKFFELGVMLVASYGFYTNNIYLLLGLLFAAGTQATFFSPMKYSVLPTHLKKNELVLGNGLIEGGTFLAILTGSIAGTYLGNTLDSNQPNLTFYVAAAIIGTAILGIITSFFIPVAKPNSPGIKVNKNIFIGSYKILKEIIQHKILFKAVIGTSWFWMCGMVLLSLFPAYVKEVIGGNSDLFMVFLTTFSIGVAIGAVSCSKILKGQITPKIAHLALYGVSICLAAMIGFSQMDFQNPSGELNITQFFAHTQGWPIFASMVGVAFFWGLYSVPLKAIIQHHADDAKRSRVIAGENISNAILMVSGNLAVSAMVESGVSILTIFTAIAIINIAVAIITRQVWKKFSK